jgi:hypothetical protein
VHERSVRREDRCRDTPAVELTQRQGGFERRHAAAGDYDVELPL